MNSIFCNYSGLRHLFTVLLWIAGVRLATAQTVSVWVTTDDQSQKMQQQSPVTFSSGTGGSNPLVIDETKTYQQVEGFGASFTDSAAYLLNQVATPTARTNAMNSLFTRTGNGIGVSFLRNPMGASDLARTHYSYDDLASGETDTNLLSFSIAHDQADIIPLVQQALLLNPQLKIMANPWSPPGWMKSSGSMITGSLLPGMYTPFAKYFVKYIQAYQAAGIPIHYISLQNEPLYVPGDYPGMDLDAVTQSNVLRNFVLPALAASNLTTKVLVYDHNWDRPDYPTTIFSDATLLASSQIAGTAWHGYGGTPGVMLTLANQFPAKGNYQTEHSGGTWVTDQVREDFEEIIHVMRSWGKAYVKWSLVLDQNHGPNLGGCNTCNPLVTINNISGALSYTIDFYTLGHFSKFVLPGAYRVYSANAGGVVSAAFLNPDSSKALVAFNDTTSSKTFQVQWGSQSFSYTLAAYAGATFTWTGTQSGGYTVNPTNQIQASSFNSLAGLQTEMTSDSLGGYDVGYADNNDYAVYQNVNFASGFTNVSARVASAGAGGTLEFRLDSTSGTRIGVVTVPITGGWQTWQTVSGSVSNASGTHNLYLVFKGGSSIGNLNWFQFSGALAPAAPTGLTATAGNAQVALSWNASVGATSYNLKRGTVNGGPYPSVTNVTATSYTNTGLINGTTYYYVVSALNAGGESTNSTQASATPTNHSPVLAAISNQTVLAGRTLLVTNSATDADAPPQLLAYSLPVAPSGASINTNTGVFTWRPAIAQSPSTQSVAVVVADNGAPVMSSTQSFLVTVTPPLRPVLTLAPMTNAQFSMWISGDIGPDYLMQTSSNLTSWQTISISTPLAMPYWWPDTNTAVFPYRFYRVLLGP